MLADGTTLSEREGGERGGNRKEEEEKVRAWCVPA
jgi:hypothetical protein